MTEERGGPFWHSVPWTLITFLVAQTLGAVVFWANIGFRVIESEKKIDRIEVAISIVPILKDRQMTNEQRISALELVVSKISVIEDRQRAVIEQLAKNSVKLDELLDRIHKP